MARQGTRPTGMSHLGLNPLRRTIGRQVDQQGRAAAAVDRIADGRRQGIHQTALDAVVADHRFTRAGRRGVAVKAHGDGFDRLAGKAAAEVLAPAGAVLGPGRGDDEAAIGRLQRCHIHTAFGEQWHPGTVRAELRPTAAPQRQHRRVGRVVARAVGCAEGEVAIRMPADPAMAHVKAHAGLAQALQPGAQQRCGLHPVRKDAPRRADEGRHPQCLDPLAQGLRREGGEQRFDLRPAAAVTAGEGREGFRMGDVEPAAAGQQELAPHRRHRIEEIHLHPGPGQGFGSHQAGGATPDDGNGGGNGCSGGGHGEASGVGQGRDCSRGTRHIA